MYLPHQNHQNFLFGFLAHRVNPTLPLYFFERKRHRTLLVVFPLQGKTMNNK